MDCISRLGGSLSAGNYDTVVCRNNIKSRNAAAFGTGLFRRYLYVLRIPEVFVHPFRLNPYTHSGVFVHPSEAVV